MDCNDYIIYIIRLYKHLALKEENLKEESLKEEDKNITKYYYFNNKRISGAIFNLTSIITQNYC